MSRLPKLLTTVNLSTPGRLGITPGRQSPVRRRYSAGSISDSNSTVTSAVSQVTESLRAHQRRSSVSSLLTSSDQLHDRYLVADPHQTGCNNNDVVDNNSDNDDRHDQDCDCDNERGVRVMTSSPALLSFTPTNAGRRSFLPICSSETKHDTTSATNAGDAFPAKCRSGERRRRWSMDETALMAAVRVGVGGLRHQWNSLQVLGSDGQTAIVAPRRLRGWNSELAEPRKDGETTQSTSDPAPVRIRVRNRMKAYA